MRFSPPIFFAALALAAANPALAARLGDPAAPLVIKDWVKGKPVDVTDRRHLYVVEFWSTSSAPCRDSVPHLTALQKKFQDMGVVVVGVCVQARDQVQPFVTNMAEKMDYIVACDDDGKTFDAYMAAYRLNGLPTAFVVGKDGTVLWLGHPMDQLEATIDEILAGKYDLQAALKRDDARTLLDQTRVLLKEYNALSAQGDPKAKELGARIFAAAGDNTQALERIAFAIASNLQNTNRDFALAGQALDKAEKIAGQQTARLIGIRAVVRFESGQFDEGLALAKKAVAACQDDKERATYERYVQVMERRMKEKNKTGPERPKKDE